MAAADDRLILTVYDYGQGGIWTWIRAASEDALRQAYPELEVVSEPPAWTGDDPPIRIVDLTDEDDEFLAALRRGRA